jgi:hypothetical protein
MPYSIEEHKHRFAAWAAGRAATVNGCRFKVEEGKSILEEAGLKRVASDLNYFPDANQFDQHHREWRNAVIASAKAYDKKFTHGVAAKLINIYLKSIFVCGYTPEHPKIKAIHPPIDSVLLDELYRQNIGGKRLIWQKARKIRWSKLSSKEYEEIIETIRTVLPENKGLWEIEQFWRGFQ